MRRYLENTDDCRRSKAQRNPGEAWHAVRAFLFVADQGVRRRNQEEAQTSQALCRTLVTHAVGIWHTVSRRAVLDQLRPEGHPVQEDDLADVSPARFEHRNP